MTTKKNRYEIYLAIFIIAVIAGTALLYFNSQEKNNTSMFPEKLGDMNLVLYRDGDIAMNEVRGLHGNNPDVNIENAFVADYRGTSTSTAKFWVSESKTV